jgi:gliding motility-associated-like protein
MKYLKYIFIFIFLSVVISFLQAKKPGFTMDKNEGCDSILVKFALDTTLVAGSNLWTWDFGDSTDNVLNKNTVSHWYYYSINPSKYSGIFIPKLTVQLNPLKSAHTDTTDTVRVHPHPNSNFFVADTFALGKLEYSFLSGKAPDTIKYSYVWSLNPGGIVDAVKETHKPGNKGRRDLFLHKFSQEGANVMKLTVTDIGDSLCSDSYQQTFNVSEKLVIPNVFTPNGDGINDNFTVQTNGKTIYHFQIFTSSGQLVFESTSRTIGWDGITSAGSKGLTGTYFYIIEPTNIVSKKRDSGFFMLLRDK